MIQSLSPELVHLIFRKLGPQDLDALRKTCRDFRRYIDGNEILQRDVFLSAWDRPSNVQSWCDLLQSATRLEQYLSKDAPRSNPDRFIYKRRKALEACTHFSPALTARPLVKTLTWLNNHFDNENNIDTLLAQSYLWTSNTSFKHELPRELAQCSAMLHVVSNINVEMRPNGIASCARNVYGINIARPLVYDTSRFKNTRFRHGPIDPSGAVDWELAEAIMIVIEHCKRKLVRYMGPRPYLLLRAPWAGLHAHDPTNYATRRFEDHPDRYESTVFQDIADLVSHDSMGFEGINRQTELDKQDPYGITGSWDTMRVYLADQVLHPNHPTQLANQSTETRQVEESFQVGRVLLAVKEICSEIPVDADPAWPCVKFHGVDNYKNIATIAIDPDQIRRNRVTGQVYTTRQGEVRWRFGRTTANGFVWASDGIQIGGARSKRGLISLCYEHQDVLATQDGVLGQPQSSSCHWKVSDDLSWQDYADSVDAQEQLDLAGDDNFSVASEDRDLEEYGPRVAAHLHNFPDEMSVDSANDDDESDQEPTDDEADSPQGITMW